MYDVIIIGAGPSGLSSAINLLRANKKVLVLESKFYGGQIINASTIENYPGIMSITGIDFSNTLFKQASDMGMNYKVEEVIKVESGKVYTKNSIYFSSSIIIAVGCVSKKLGIEDKFIGRGVSYCATCDGNFYKNKPVMVVGGGDTALTDALYLSSIASVVYLVHRTSTFKGAEKYVKELEQKDNVKFIMNSNVTSLVGDNVLEGAFINESEIINISGLFIAIGQVPNSSIVKDLLKLDKYGYIESDIKTSIDGIYVVGDVRKKDLRQLTTAVSDGAIAASLIVK